MRLYTPVLLALVGCGIIPSDQVGYYDGATGSPPTIDGIDADEQNGNVGGVVVTIDGSGFGDSADDLMVQFGNRNATIVSVSDTQLVVTVPQGPMGGGSVNVTVGTVNGMAQAPFLFDMGPDLLESSAGSDEIPGQDGSIDGSDVVGYILVNNFWESCYGGLSGRLDDTYGETGCKEIAYIGNTGIDGTAEALNFAYPRLGSAYQGFFGATDLSAGEWRVQRPGEVAYAAQVENFHVDLGRVRLKNRYYADEDPVCVDLAETATYRYGGGEADAPAPYVLYGSGLPEVTKASGGECDEGTLYDVDELEMCARITEEGVPDYIYGADWPVDQNFFASSRDGLEPVEVRLDMDDVGVDDLPLVLPEPLVVYNTGGFVSLIGDDGAGAADLWGLSIMEHCFDKDDDGEDLADDAFTFEWKVSPIDTPDGGDDVDYPDVEGQVLGYRTYVRVSLTQLSMGWFGGIAYPTRATITVPDDYQSYEVEESRNKVSRYSTLSVPASVMYQFATITPPAGGGQFSSLAAPTDDAGYLIVEFQRVTEYTVQSDAGPVAFTYVTGDFGFYEWKNPTDDTCHDCADGDGDGWVDDVDPDCLAGEEELGTTGTACNDGVDNEGDGLVDAADLDCEDGVDNDEYNCNNNKDDDGDGFRDEDDADCQRGDSEMFADGCVNGLDDDGDGWADSDDPDCLDDTAEVGVGESSCNDGADDDGDGWTDVADPDCTAATSTELGLGVGECNDGLDNDDDGAVDALDLECVDAWIPTEAP